MEEREADQHSPERPHHAGLRQPREGNQRFGMNLPWWRLSFVGYAVCVLFMGILLFISSVERLFAVKPHISNALLSLVTIVVAFLWGVRPALFAIVLGLIILGAFIISPSGLFTSDFLDDIVMYGPWLLGEFVVIIIVAQREKAQQQKHVAELKMREQLNQQFERENRFKDALLSRVAHELRTPITTIRAQAQLALRRLRKSPQGVPEQLALPVYLEKIDAQTHHLQAFIDDILDISRLRSEKMFLRLTSCNLGSLCCEVIEDQCTLFRRHIELDLPSEPLILQADCQRLTQVIINFVGNALKYSPENTLVRVCAHQESSHVVLAVHNDDSVIPQDQQVPIFEPFYRTPEAEHSLIRGHGLGLSISKEIVERHGGQIWVESSEREGTTFFVQLPCNDR